MKIVILCTQLEGGGAQRASFNLSKGLINKGFDCENWFLYKKHENYDNLEIKKIVILNRQIESKKDYFWVLVSYYNLLRKKKPDAIIAFAHYANVLGLIIAWIAGVKIRIASHRNPSWGNMSKKLKYLDKLCAYFNIYTSITSVSNSTKKSFRHYYLKDYNRIVVIENGVELRSITETKKNCRRIFNLPENEFIIGTVGRLDKQKNHIYSINLIKKSEGVFLTIAGGGILKDELKQHVVRQNLEKRVFLLDEIPNIQVPYFLKSLDIFIMPSIFEGLSNALLEAMAMGIPVLVSDIDAQKDVVVGKDGEKYGEILSLNNDEVWINTINDLKSDSEKFNLYVKRSLKRASDFSVEAMTKGFLRLLVSNTGNYIKE